jgi:hypothetical protein
MANLGEITEIVNASELTLEVDTGNDTSNKYILLTNLNLHVGRTEDRTATTGTGNEGVLYTYGKGDNWFTATLLVSTPELSSLNTLGQINTDGDMTPQAWMIRAHDVSGTDKFLFCTGVLRDYDISKPTEGKVTIDIFVRITGDSLTISDTNPL